ncbi:GGDEF domain-containing protein [Actinokineospora inagensis]|uniref:GGDEF domain-containing protein n=1 Tax=Actinokineospora inagensis TaxID=103730 RepID=UPI00041D43AB|nr:GGDEF domain-containing protein [Actinokineospora inagensis]
MAKPRWVQGYELSTTPRQVVAYVLAIDLLAIAATGATAGLLPVSPTDGARLAVLVGCAIVHVELCRSIERERKLAAGSGPFVDCLTPWHFAGALVLPPSLSSLFVVFTQTYVWYRVWRGRRPLYKWVFSAATVLLATQASAVVLYAAPGPHPGVPPGWVGLGFEVAVAALRWLVNYSLVLGAVLATSPDLRAGKIVNGFGDQILEAGALGLGLAAAGLLQLDARLLVGIVVGLVALHRGVLLAQFRHASRTDGKTGLYTPAWWNQIATGAMQRAADARTSVGVLMLDLDHFKRLNDNYGHLAGDQVLRAVAETITSAIRSYDAACRWGGEEFAVVLPHIDSEDLYAIGDRIRRQVRTLNPTVTTGDGTTTDIPDLTISIGGALYPTPGITTLTDLQLAADAALYAAKHNGRDCVKLATPPNSGSVSHTDANQR